ncbi:MULTISPECIES: DJ-1/PfpI family protein [Shewanella]|uniref:Cyclohexyl-isocyanide hydratase n=2 Tax=Shewanella TaxID=22 RepID=A0A4R2F4G0_9GAMM|nr:MULTISPECIES: DJ-1/PfpI family protein [Shewanella]MBO1271711.1 DJ-1/PfpI family protein [Shewanella sp. 4t3-1-2LB]MCL1075419.1 DJ-1/PfpI family protein [Shewanella dokdonensis]QVK22109.1 DJ-1/PfpI family protein [Shewanella dokdonensis]TCN79613.1 cyclohexyl-isocyanide hydratase [Shewanella fodinae]
MKVAFIIFDQMTTLDLIGAYDPLTRLKSMNILPEFEWDICSFTKEVTDDKGLRLFPDKVGETLVGYDLIFVPGGFGTRSLQFDRGFTDWLKTGSSAKLKVSVCTGALLLGSAGFLAGKRATTHPNAFGELETYCDTVVDQRVVDEGDVVTGRGVSSSIDLGLFLVERLAGVDARIRISKQMDYPYWCGS